MAIQKHGMETVPDKKQYQTKLGPTTGVMVKLEISLWNILAKKIVAAKKRYINSTTDTRND